MELTEDDEFLILACDGVWDVMSNQVVDFGKYIQIQMVVIQMKNLVIETLVDEALKRGSTDNITTYVVRL